MTNATTTTPFAINTSETQNSSSHHAILKHIPHSVILASEPSWQIPLIFGIVLTFALTYVPIAVAARRVARHTPPFIIFFSESLTNVYILSVISLIFANQLFFRAFLFGSAQLETILGCLCAYTSLLHYTLIAVNRGFAIFFPLKYDVWWSRKRILALSIMLWITGTALLGVDIALYAFGRRPAIVLGSYFVVQRGVTFSSLAIYTASLLWVMLGRLQRMWERLHSVSPAAAAATVGTAAKQHPATTTSTTIIARGVDLRLFAYCFASFLPNCYNLFVRPARNSLHYHYYAVIRVESNGVLLYVMSSLLREQIPLVPACVRAGKALWLRLGNSVRGALGMTLHPTNLLTKPSLLAAHITVNINHATTHIAPAGVTNSTR